MALAALIVSILALLVAASSLAWQARMFHLSGGRVRVELHKGGWMKPTTKIASVKVSDMKKDWPAWSRGLGYTTSIVAIKVVNIGRLPVTVSSWGFVNWRKAEANPHGIDWHGPELPHRLEANADAIWFVEESTLRGLFDGMAKMLWFPKRNFKLRATARLADGRKVKSRDKIGKP